MLVTSDENRLITHPASPGTTSVPLQPFPEGRACHVRRSTFDYPLPSGGD
ncbi:hypothetical protein THTE_0385 [Thermogutta terrifontis]|uniref:Uncharacterized protein n=1 Tax=Thermogutta terrifontis TaxID=1331910 RepID=A0A286RAL2_9BACT|nr:hypothetical protein THTE_0385 [Thermogutta terrifontis]